jgi:hypothetical protein
MACRTCSATSFRRSARFRRSEDRHGVAGRGLSAATGTGEVTRNIAGGTRPSEETGVAAAQVPASASALPPQSDRLNAEVHRFQDAVRAA